MKNENLTIITSESELTNEEMNAVQQMLKTETFNAKAIYLAGKDHIKRIAIEVIKSGGENKIATGANKSEIATTDLEKKEGRKRHKKFERRNKGVNKDLRAYFDAEKKKKVKEIKFYDLYAVVKAVHPNMTEKYLKLYLYNKKYFADVSLDWSKKVINLKDGKAK